MGTLRATWKQPRSSRESSHPTVIASFDCVLCYPQLLMTRTPRCAALLSCRYPIFRGKTVTGSKSTIKEAGRMKVRGSGACCCPSLSLFIVNCALSLNLASCSMLSGI